MGKYPMVNTPGTGKTLALIFLDDLGGSVCGQEGIWIVIAEMEEDKNKIFVNAMVNLGYKRLDVNVALARSFGNEEVNMGWLQFYRLRRQRPSICLGCRCTHPNIAAVLSLGAYHGRCMYERKSLPG